MPHEQLFTLPSAQPNLKLKFSDGDEVKKMREHWRSTCRTWHTLTAGDKVMLQCVT